TPRGMLTARSATDAPDAVTLTDAATAGRLRVTVGTSALEFANQAALVLASGLTAADKGKAITLANTVKSTGLNGITVNAGAGPDVVSVPPPAAPWSAPPSWSTPAAATTPSTSAAPPARWTASSAP